MKYYTDGFTIEANPSKTGGGYTIADENGEIIHREVISKIGFTNNEGEILGLLKCFEIANNGDSVSTDSIVCIGWINARKSKVRKDLNHIFAKCHDLVKQKNINLMWERRNFNLAGLHNQKNK